MKLSTTARLYAGQYDLIDPPQPTSTSDKVEVVELFWYTCPHCYYFDRDYLKDWHEKTPDYVEFIQMPAVFGAKNRWRPLVKAYYVAEALGILNQVHTPLFEAVHDKKPRLRNSVKAVQDFQNVWGQKCTLHHC